MTMQENGLTKAQQQAMENLYGAFNHKNPELLELALMPDWQDIPLGPGQQPGLAGMKPIVDMFAAAFPDVHIEVLDMFGRDGRAAVRARITGTHRGSSSASRRPASRSPSPSTSSIRWARTASSRPGTWKTGSAC